MMDSMAIIGIIPVILAVGVALWAAKEAMDGEGFQTVRLAVPVVILLSLSALVIGAFVPEEEEPEPDIIGSEMLKYENSTVLGLKDGYEPDSGRYIIDLGDESLNVAANAFQNDKRLVGIRSGLTYLGESAFYGCTSLKFIDSDLALTNFATFAGCSSLESVEVYSIAENAMQAFAGCSSLKTATLGNNTIPAGCFVNCTSLESVTSLGTRIYSGAFYGCSSLKTVSMPNLISIDSSTTTTGNYWSGSAFYGCTSLESIDFPKLTSCGNAFYGCSSLKTVSMPMATTLYASFDSCTSLESVYLPKVMTVNNGVFNGCTSLKTVSLPSLKSASVYNNGAGCFQGCTSLESVNTGGILAEKMFYGCKSLKSYSTTSDIPSYCFASSGITDGIFKSGRIYTHAFDGCTSLESISLPNAKRIDANAFNGCTSLKTVSMPNSASIYTNAFSGCIAIEAVSFGPLSTLNNNSMPDWTFYSADGEILTKNATNLANSSFEGTAERLVKQ